MYLLVCAEAAGDSELDLTILLPTQDTSISSKSHTDPPYDSSLPLEELSALDTICVVFRLLFF